ncbi:M3 family metallopeptidase [Vibrio hepatarius]|uniref:M3 family metallopeptidase n=1 Tax=Vibrio hepatarius TaxID=171383 RepID=UPI001C099B63|nr:M3 family metallopeptidase [Vibrio hepatarius]MBU2897270.1 hypothetical protein [Vibrio hepatarius]
MIAPVHQFKALQEGLPPLIDEAKRQINALSHMLKQQAFGQAKQEFAALITSELAIKSTFRELCFYQEYCALPESDFEAIIAMLLDYQEIANNHADLLVQFKKEHNFVDPILIDAWEKRKIELFGTNYVKPAEQQDLEQQYVLNLFNNRKAIAQNHYKQLKNIFGSDFEDSATFSNALIKHCFKNCTSTEKRKLVYELYCQLGNEGAFDNTYIALEILEQRRADAKRLGYRSFLDMLSSQSPVNSLPLNFVTEHWHEHAGEISAIIDQVEKEALDTQGNFGGQDIVHFLYQLYPLGSTGIEQTYFPISKTLSNIIEFLSATFGFKEHIKRTANNIWHITLDGLKHQKICLSIQLCHDLDGSFVDVFYDFTSTNDYSVMIACNVEHSNGYFTFNDLATLMHEFGHAMHAIFSLSEGPLPLDYKDVCVDEIEIPSTAFELLTYSLRFLQEIAPQNLSRSQSEELTKLIHNHKVHRLIKKIKDVEFALFDLIIHSHESQYDTHVLENVRTQVYDLMDVRVCSSNFRFYNNIAHLFSHGYEGKYYTYLWSESVANTLSQAITQAINTNRLNEIGNALKATFLCNNGRFHSTDLLSRFLTTLNATTQ